MTNQMTNPQIGMLGVHLVAAELIRRGFTVSPTSRDAVGADLLATDALCQKAWSVQVKTTAIRPTGWWIVNKQAETTFSDSHVYVFVKFENDQPVFLVVPSKTVAKHVQQRGKFRAFYRSDAGTIGWKDFGKTDRLTLPFKRQPRVVSPALTG